ncbi:MAG: SBBP repeat-containing protein [Chitinophagales bacterium]|nr:SBBP repeat-containing protein [Chitinophagales bacterium]
MLTLAYDKNGNLLWNRSISSTNPSKDAKGRDIKAEATFDGHLYVTGKLDKGSDHDYVTASYTQDGDLRWLTQYDNDFGSDDKAIDIALDAANNPIVSGICVKDTLTRYVTVKYKQADAFLPSPTDTPSTAYAFYENRGQILVNDSTVADSVFFYTNAGNPQLYVGDKRLSYVIARSDTVGMTDTVYRIDMVIGSTVSNNKEPVFYDKQTADHLNYFLGNLPQPVTNVKGYNRIVQKEIYRDIDWQLYSTTTGIKNYFVVKPQTEAGQILIKYQGADSLSIHNNRLTLHTQIGNIRFDSLIAFTVDTLGNQTSVTISYDSVGLNQFGFALGGYNSSEWLVVEQGRSIEGAQSSSDWSTYFGGNGFDEATNLCFDNLGAVYVCGNTSSTNFPTITGQSFLSSLQGFRNSFIAKFDKDGKPLCSTYYGGSSSEISRGIVANSVGSIYLVGQTASDNLPLPQGSTSSKNSTYDGFIARFSYNLSQLQFARYFGGDNEDVINEVAVDNQNNVYIVGSTKSSASGFPTFPKTNAYNQSTTTSGYSKSEGFIAEFNSGNVQVWGSFFGGDEDDYLTDIKISGNGKIYLAGATATNTMASSNGSNPPCGVPISPIYFPDCNPGSGAYHQNSKGGGTSTSNMDAFVVELNSNGSLAWSTLFGGSANEASGGTSSMVMPHRVSVAINPLDNSKIYLSGMIGFSGAPSYNFPNFYSGAQFGQATYVGHRGYIAEFTNRVQSWGTTLLTGATHAIDMETDFSNNVYLSGWVYETTLHSSMVYSSSTCAVPADVSELPNCNPGNIYYQNSYGGGIGLEGDGYLLCFDGANTLKWSSFYGGNRADEIFGMRFDPVYSRMYVCGRTQSTDQSFLLDPQTGNYMQTANAGGTNGLDAFIARFDIPFGTVSMFDLSESTKTLTLFPNPAGSNVSLLIPSIVSKPTDLRIYNTLGALAEQFKIMYGEKEVTLNISKFPNGFYTVVLYTENGSVYTAKFIKAN